MLLAVEKGDDALRNVGLRLPAAKFSPPRFLAGPEVVGGHRVFLDARENPLSGDADRFVVPRKFEAFVAGPRVERPPVADVNETIPKGRARRIAEPELVLLPVRRRSAGFR